ncbi:glycosyltransferase family 4 protein [Enterococcus lactis]|uniref:Glycosyl transferase, group 1 family protein n=1 Tax=Enterococcus hirae TaxID=1354 RepID=A0A4U9Q7G7_ENTHR|nr:MULTISPECIES: glycosyltransferase family 4 protein [Enterococcus]MBX8934792.1 glycosyltransferase family 4 protein [Enterobacter sp. K62_1]HCJ4251889.1 glycosyltransferase family 4 protein [Enterococcus faecalis]EGP4756694.1 glycosyltransferase family 4 protein [Enterococcus faecium]EGP4844468.1 glycosyltransferase family 4 protein [Enterococcus faecium]EGP4945694.1 glycosyltransferase family 4 protein [Enterococcus faecium]
MKKILIFNGWYLPSKRCGGPVTSIRNTVEACSDEFQFYIVALNHDFGDNIEFPNIQKGWNQVGKAKVLYVPDKYFDFNMNHLEKLFTDLKPDLVWFSGILHPEIKLYTMRLSRKLNFPVLFSPRGEVSRDRVTNLKAYKKVPYLFLARRLGFYKGAWFHATSDDEFEGLKYYIGAPADRISYVRNIPVMPDNYRDDYEKKSGEIRIVFISRIHEVKNLKFAVEVATKVKNYNVIFDVYGPKESQDYWDECEEIGKNAPTNVKLNYCRVLAPDEVGSTFKKYDCFLFPTINENYGHVIAESLANGCPVILSKGTTPWDDLDNIAGYVCNLGDEEAFVEAIGKIAVLNTQEFNSLSNNTVEYYKKKIAEDDAIKGHIDMFNRIISS